MTDFINAIVDKYGKDATIEMLFGILDNLPLPLSLVDEEFATVYANPAKVKSGLSERSDPEEVQKLLRARKPVIQNETIADNDGSERHYKIHKQAVSFKQNGKVRRVVLDVNEEQDGNRIDVNELRHMRQELELSSAAMSNLSQAVVVRDRDLKYRLVNPQFEALYGKPASEVIGRTAVELFGEEVAAGFDARNLEVIETGQEYQTEEILKFPDGREIVSLTEVKRIEGSEGEPYACVTITNVTDLRDREAALAEKTSELALVSAAVENLSAGVLIKDGQARYRFVNDAFARILGHPTKDILGKTTSELLGEELGQAYDARERKVLETGEAIEFEEQFPGPDGAEISAINSISRITDSNCEDHICVVLKNVSEIAAREHKLQSQAVEIEQHRQRMEQFAESSADWFWETGKDLRYTFFSDGLSKTLGLTTSELIGKTRAELWGEASLDEDKNSHLKQMEDHELFKDFTYQFKSPDGGEYWIAVSGSPVFDCNGNFTGYMGSGRDVTEQIMRARQLAEAHKDLARSKKRIEAYANASADWFWEMDAELRFSYFSETYEKIAKVDPKTLLGKTRRETGLSGMSDEKFEAFVNLLDRHEPYRDFVNSRTMEDGAVVWHSTSGNPVFDEDGSFAGYQGTGKDVTRQVEREREIEEARLEAQQADRAKSEFLANMSHEIRTPMNGVMGMAELLAKTELDAKQKMFTDVIVKSGASLLTIINDILDFSKLDAGQMELDPVPFNLAEAIEDVATLVSSRVAEKDLELIVRIDPSLPQMLVGDVGRIRQIVTNLMGNAVKFTEKGHVYVNVTEQPATLENGRKRLRFEIEDTGIGIPSEKCDTVFER